MGIAAGHSGTTPDSVRENLAKAHRIRHSETSSPPNPMLDSGLNSPTKEPVPDENCRPGVVIYQVRQNP